MEYPTQFDRLIDAARTLCDLTSGPAEPEARPEETPYHPDSLISGSADITPQTNGPTPPPPNASRRSLLRGSVETRKADS